MEKDPRVIGFVRDVRLWSTPEEVREEGITPDYRFSPASERCCARTGQ
ncbi:hypothetical protein [Streptomyces sp. NPDC058385]